MAQASDRAGKIQVCTGCDVCDVCHVLPCKVMSYHVLPCHVVLGASTHVMAVLFCGQSFNVLAISSNLPG